METHEQHIQRFKAYLQEHMAIESSRRPLMWSCLLDAIYIITNDVLCCCPPFVEYTKDKNEGSIVHAISRYSTGESSSRKLPIELVCVGCAIHNVMIDFIDGENKLGDYMLKDIENVFRSYRRGMTDEYPKEEKQMCQVSFDYIELVRDLYRSGQ